MRRSYDANFIIDNDVLIGITLGADFCAEHEDGIKRIQEQFGLDTSKVGIQKRTIQHVPEYLHLYVNEKKTEAALVFSSWLKSLEEVKKYPELRPDNKGLGTAWDDATFGIYCREASQIIYLEQLYEAFQKQDIAMWLGKIHNIPFENAGLVITIISHVPRKYLDIMYEGDEDQMNLQQTAQKTGIEGRLEKAKKLYFALAPKWTKEIHGDTKTQYGVMFWLNPRQQHLYNAGWFSVEDLDLWIKNAGPVMKE